MGFRSNQFYNPPGNPTGDPRSSSRPNNQLFTYPDRVVRGMRKGRDGEFSEYSERLSRGYIRNIEFGENPQAVRKCSFQFNPSKLRQVVEANSSMLNVLQQDPYQWAQPFGGDISFQFELLFDRSAELNNSTDRPADSVLDPDNVNIWERYGPGQVGVLHDISVLASVIGLGISGSQVEYLKDLLRARLTSDVSNAAVDILNTANTAGAPLDPQDVLDIAQTNIDNFVGEDAESIETNSGNSAFLIPLPVRVVFSSLYVVEGLVREIDINFVKFTTKMVPMIASVVINLEAKYVGFSKPKTFFTEALSSAVTPPRSLTSGQTAAASSIIESLEKETSTMTLALVGKRQSSFISPGRVPAIDFTPTSDVAYGTPIHSNDTDNDLPLYSIDVSGNDYDTKNIARGVTWCVPDPETTNKYDNAGRTDNPTLRSWVESDGTVNFRSYIHVIRFSGDVLDWLEVTPLGDSFKSIPSNVLISRENTSQVDNYERVRDLYALLGSGEVIPLSRGGTLPPASWYQTDWVPYTDNDISKGSALDDDESARTSWETLRSFWSDSKFQRTRDLIGKSTTSSGPVPFNTRLDLPSQICAFNTEQRGLQLFPAVQTLCEVYAGWNENTNRYTNPKTLDDFNRSTLLAFGCEDPEGTNVDIYYAGIDDQNYGSNSAAGGVGSLFAGKPSYGVWSGVSPTSNREQAPKWGSTNLGHSGLYHLVRFYAGIYAEKDGVKYRGEGFAYKLLKPGEDYGSALAIKSANGTNDKGFVEGLNKTQGFMEKIPISWRFE